MGSFLPKCAQTPDSGEFRGAPWLQGIVGAGSSHCRIGEREGQWGGGENPALGPAAELSAWREGVKKVPGRALISQVAREHSWPREERHLSLEATSKFLHNELP